MRRLLITYTFLPCVPEHQEQDNEVLAERREYSGHKGLSEIDLARYIILLAKKAGMRIEFVDCAFCLLHSPLSS